MSRAVQETTVADKGLKGGSLGLLAVIVIGVASTAPGYSLAAGIGGIAGEAGLKSPFIMLFAFIPMGCIAASFYYMNKADPDCGTNFTWGVRAFGPKTGWIAGWGCIVADLVIMPNLAGISGQYLVLLFSKKWAENIYLTTFLGVLFIIAMCWICWKGIELSARSQVALLGTELAVLTIFAVVAIVKAFNGVSRTTTEDLGLFGVSKEGLAAGTDSLPAYCKQVADGAQCAYHSAKPSLSWLSPSGLSVHAVIAGLVLAVFAYWGWDTCVSVNEEAEDSSRTPGMAAVLSTFILLAIYLITSYGTVALLGPKFVADHSGDAMAAVAEVALPTILVKLLIIAVLTSAAASCQTTILPATRTMLSMGSHGAAPAKLAQINRANLTPDFSTWLFGVVSVVWYLLLVVVSHNTSTNAYSASIAAVGMAIALYYGVSGFSCIWFYRRYLTKSLRNFVLIGVLPFIGGAILIFVFIKTVWDARLTSYTDPASGIFGVGTVLVIGTLLLVVGVPLMLVCSKKYPRFFTFRPDPVHTVPDPYSENTLAAPLGTYVKGGKY